MARTSSSDQPGLHRRSRSRSQSTSSRTGRSRSNTASKFRSLFKGPFSRTTNSKLISLHRLLKMELNLPEHTEPSIDPLAADIDLAMEQIIAMVKVPLVLERFMIVGLLICFNSFLTLFTLVPIRIAVMLVLTIRSWMVDPNHRTFSKLAPAKKDIVTLALIVCSILFLSVSALDISKMYHDVRGSAQIKLYVMFGVLEVADKLCSAIGQDILDILYGLVASNVDLTATHMVKLAIFFSASVVYLALHAYILIYQTVSLNVAANSYSNALLTLLFSNQFSELRASVFKKFDIEGVFQLSMSDLTERYQLALMLGLISFRNFLQLSSVNQAIIPDSWASWNKRFGALFAPSIVVLGSEIFVDWLKHCYIVKFNKLKPRIYNNFTYVLALDYMEVFKTQSILEKNSNSRYELTDYITLTRRIGLPLLATTVCCLTMSLKDFSNIFKVTSSNRIFSFLGSCSLLASTFIVLLFIRLVLGLVLLKLNSDVKSAYEADHEVGLSREDIINNAFSDTEAPESPSAGAKTPIELNYIAGIPNSEQSTINPNTRSFLYFGEDAVPPTPEEKRNKELTSKYEAMDSTNLDEGLSNVQRYEMTSKRIW